MFILAVTRFMAVLVSILTTIGSIFLLGSRDEAQKATINALKEAQSANTKAIQARRDAVSDADSGGLLKDDGYKRD